MKQILTALILCLALTASAQVKLGITAGMNRSTAQVLEVDLFNVSPSTSYNIGLGIDIPLLNKLSFEPVALFSNKGWSFTDNLDNSTDYSLQYISAQLLAKIHLTKNIKIIGGPEFSYLLSAKANDNPGPVVGIFNDGEMGVIAGLEVSLLKRIAFHAKYNFGINEVLNFNATDENGNGIGTASYKNQVVMVGVTLYPFKIEVN